MTAPTVADTRRHLEELPDLCAYLPDAAQARAAIEGPRPAPASKPPLRLDILHLQDTRTKWHDPAMALCDPDRQGVLPYLWGWVRDVEADALDQSPELPPEPPEVPTVANCCDWLTKMLTFAATLPQWPELAHGIKRTHQAVRDATAGVRDVEEKPVPCTRCDDGTLRDVTTGRLWQCDRCGHEVSVIAVTLGQAAKITGCPRSTLYAWRDRNLLQRVKDGNRAALYDLGSIRRLVSEQRARDILND